MLRNRKGFTILEVLIALVLLAFGILALLRVMPVALRASKKAEETTIATLLAQQHLETWRACDKDPGSKCAGTSGICDDDKYEWELSATSPMPDVWVCSVSVWWPEPEGEPGDREKQKVVNLTTYMFRYPQ